MPTPRLEAKNSLRRPAISIPPVLDLNGGGDFDIHHWRRADTGYTSLRDILTSSSSAAGGLLSPSASASASAAPGAGEIQIRNRLVKQAAYAYAYLQPTPSSLESSRRRRRGPIRRLLAVLSCGLTGSCFDFVGRFFQSIRR